MYAKNQIQKDCFSHKILGLSGTKMTMFYAGWNIALVTLQIKKLTDARRD